MVNDEGAVARIAELRTALGDDRNIRLHRDLPKIGYRLIASVVPTAQSSDLLLAAGAIPGICSRKAADACRDQPTPAPPPARGGKQRRRSTAAKVPRPGGRP